MATIPFREAELLSYLQGCGPVGTWVCPITAHIREDLRLSRAQTSHLKRKLEQRGYIEMRHTPRLNGKEYRVLVRVEHLEIIDHGTMSEEARKVQSLKALAREERKRRQKKRKLIRFAGFDPFERRIGK